MVTIHTEENIINEYESSAMTSMVLKSQCISMATNIPSQILNSRTTGDLQNESPINTDNIPEEATCRTLDPIKRVWLVTILSIVSPDSRGCSMYKVFSIAAKPSAAVIR